MKNYDGKWSRVSLEGNAVEELNDRTTTKYNLELQQDRTDLPPMEFSIRRTETKISHNKAP